MQSSSAADARALSSLLLDLHRSSNELAYRAFLEAAFRRVSELVPIDSGLFSAGRVESGLPVAQDTVLHEQPTEFMASWENVKHQDLIALHAMTHPGVTGNFDIEGPVFDGCDDARRHCRAWGLAQVLCTSTIDTTAGLYWVLSMYRKDQERPFSESERATVELLMPHLVAAARQARITWMRSVSRMSGVHGQAAAVVSADERVIDADPEFLTLVRREWPDWTGPVLPTELASVVRAGSGKPSVRTRIVVRADEVDGLRLVHARAVVVADRLSPREREIARAFSQGETHREIGDRVGIAPNTVRRHLTNIYEKLGISSKVELHRMIDGL